MLGTTWVPQWGHEMDNGEQGKKQNHSTFRSNDDDGGRGGMKRRVAFGQKNQKQKHVHCCCTCYVLFCLSCINPSSQVCFFFPKKKTTLQSTSTHIRARSWKRKPKRKGRKKAPSWKRKPKRKGRKKE